MKDTTRRLVIILGMHRSGSSAITRSLQSLGVDLGSNLMQASPGINDKGFFEDIEFCRINERILRKLGSAWSSLAPMDPGLFTSPALQPLEVEAKALLRNRFQTANFFGVKDPRLPILLKFWQPLLQGEEVQVSYVISSRNPRSIAHSLQRRDDFQRQKSYYLWFIHMLSALSHTSAKDRIVVDYDRMLDSTAYEIQRIARFLGVVCDPNSPQIKSYQDDFLDRSLRHWSFNQDDLRQDPHVPAEVIKLYDLLVNLTQDRVQTDHETVATLNHLRIRQSEMAPLLNYVRSLEEKIGELTGHVADQEQKRQHLNAEILRKDEQLAIMKQQREEERKTMAAEAAILQEMVAAESARADEFKRQQEHNLTTMRSLLTSRSWRLTQPLRAVAECCRSLAHR